MKATGMIFKETSDLQWKQMSLDFTHRYVGVYNCVSMNLRSLRYPWGSTVPKQSSIFQTLESLATMVINFMLRLRDSWIIPHLEKYGLRNKRLG